MTVTFSVSALASDTLLDSHAREEEKKTIAFATTKKRTKKHPVDADQIS